MRPDQFNSGNAMSYLLNFIDNVFPLVLIVALLLYLFLVMRQLVKIKNDGGRTTALLVATMLGFASFAHVVVAAYPTDPGYPVPGQVRIEIPVGTKSVILVHPDGRKQYVPVKLQP